MQGADDGAGRPGGRAGAAVVGAARAVAKGLLRGGEPLSLQCCVMSVCLVRRCVLSCFVLFLRGADREAAQPWDTLARDVLFKSPTTVS